ncbi:MAG: monovalent cation/H(+) antiporter subunit G [Wenzhouxiangellaceae bacterium]|nr:monovalent cation/H(+) antiporter subunit G [Wenzhouxiangellaceae bacterium]
MAETLVNLLSWLLMLGGGAFGILGGLGLLRFPDFYSRMHAAGMADTLCALMIVAGLILQTGLSIASIKLALVLWFLLFTAPTASHALAHAARIDGVEARLSQDAAVETDTHSGSN